MSIAVQMAETEAEALKAKAKDLGKSVSVIVREALTKAYGMSFHEIKPKTKYASPEAAKAALKAQAKARRDLDNQILKAIHEGKMEEAIRLTKVKGNKARKAKSAAAKKDGPVTSKTPAKAK